MSAFYRRLDDAHRLPASVECPFCGTTKTELQTPFGSVLSVAQYYCRRCRTIFEWIKRAAPADPGHTSG